MTRLDFFERKPDMAMLTARAKLPAIRSLGWDSSLGAEKHG